MSDTFFTKSGSSPGDAGSTRPSSQRPPQKKPIKRAFTGMAGSSLAQIEEPIAASAGTGISPEEPPTFEAAAAPNKRGRPPKGDKAMTPAERKAKQRADEKRDLKIAALTKEQTTDDRTGGRYGPGINMADAPSAKGLLITGGGGEDALAVADQHQTIDENGEPTYEYGRNGQVTTCYHGEEGMLEGTDTLTVRCRETVSQFQKNHKVKKNWKYDERDKEEIARKNAEQFITSHSVTFFDWSEADNSFVALVQPQICRNCCKTIPQEHVCKICDHIFWSLREAVDHIIESVGVDETHRRRVLRGSGRPHYIPHVDKQARLLKEQIF